MCERCHDVRLGFTEGSYRAGTHLCLIYDDEGERRRIIEQFLESGLTAGEKVAYLTDTLPVSEVQSWLEELGLPDPRGLTAGAFELAFTEDVYCAGGSFDPDKMFDFWRGFLAQATEHGFSGARATGETGWALHGIPGSDRLIEYEALLTGVLEKVPVTALCQYDANQYSGAVLLDILRVHPLMIVRGQVVKNPYFISAEEFLRERTDSRGTPSSA